MAKLLKINNRVANARNFRESLGRTTPAPEILYLYFGREAAWPDENNPPSPTEDIAYEFTTRNAIIGIKRISITNTAFVVARHNWSTGTVYDKYSASDASLFAKQFYVLSTVGNVYKCLDNNSGGQSIVEPTGTSTSSIATGDGYTWKFMYNLSSSMIDSFLTSDWLPVPYGGQETTLQTSVETNAVYTSGSPSGGHGSNAVEELGAKSVMISQTLDKDESGTFPTDDDYRQFGLWLNPELLASGNATGTLYSVNDSNTLIDQATGSILSIDNRKIITRSSEQAEKFQLILTF